MRLATLGFLILFGALWGCSRTAVTTLPNQLVVLFSNETENELYKCLCHANQQGGFSRRASVFARDAVVPLLVVDVGMFSARRPDNPYDQHKESYVHRLHHLLGYSALNAGKPEFALGLEGLRQLNVESGDLMISANVVDAAGELVLPPYRIVEVEGLKVGIVALLQPQSERVWATEADRLKATDPVEALRRVWGALEEQSDIQILLSQLEDPQVDLITLEFPDLDAVLGGPGWRGATEFSPQDKNGIPYAKVGNRGKYVGRLVLTLDTTDRRNPVVGGAEGSVIALGDDVPETPAVVAVLDEFKASLKTPGAPRQDQYDPYTEGGQFRYAGAQYCQTCHGAIYAGFLRTRHAEAFQTLSAKDEHENPGCLPCHTVGYGEPDGYDSPEKGPTYMLANVQCESCHGPSSDHAGLARDWEDGKIATEPTDWKIERPSPQAETCTQCHDPDNDPDWVNNEWPFASKVAEIACSQWVIHREPTGLAPPVSVRR